MPYAKLSTLALSAALCSAAFAGDTLTFTGLGPTGTANLSGIANGNFYVGKLTMTDTALGPITTVCADLYHDISTGNQWNNTTIHTASMTDGTNFYIQEAGNIVAKDFTGALSSDQAEGLQFAVWKALYDNSPTFNLSSGNVQSDVSTSSAAYLDAVSYYADRNTAGDALYFQAGMRVDNGAIWGQSQLAPVPEPTSLCVLGLGAAALLRRRKRA